MMLEYIKLISCSGSRHVLLSIRQHITVVVVSCRHINIYYSIKQFLCLLIVWDHIFCYTFFVYVIRHLWGCARIDGKFGQVLLFVVVGIKIELILMGWVDIFYVWIFWVLYNIYSQAEQAMSFQNSYGPDGSININVIPSFGHIVVLPEQQKNTTLADVQRWRATKGALRQRPADFDPSRYASFSTREVVEEPVDQTHIHEYVERSRLSRRLGF